MDTTHERLAITLACINCMYYIMISIKPLWARRTKCHSPPYPYQYESKNNIMEWFNIYMGCTQGLFPTA